MNTIVISKKEFFKILDELGSESFDNFIFNSFSMVIQYDYGIKLSINVNYNSDKKILVCNELVSGKNKSVAYSFVLHWNEDILNPEVITDVQANNEDIYGIIEWCLRPMSYIMTESRNRRIQMKNKTIDKIEYSRECKKSNSINKIYLLEDIISYTAEHMTDEEVHFHRTCPCWNVRGFYRHYKDGKVVWIKPHKRGKDRLTAEPKDKTYYTDK